MLKKNWTISLALLVGCSLILAPMVASAGGIITHGRAYSEDGLAQEEEEESDDDQTENTKTQDQVELENELYLFTAFVFSSHAAIYAEAGTTEGGFLENSAEANEQAGGCNQVPISSLSLLLALGLLRRRRRS